MSAVQINDPAQLEAEAERVFQELIYHQYAYNRSAFPEVEFQRWERAFVSARLLEERYQKEISRPVCDACLERIAGELFETAKLPLSKFCCVDCRDGAEHAAWEGMRAAERVECQDCHIPRHYGNRGETNCGISRNSGSGSIRDDIS